MSSTTAEPAAAQESSEPGLKPIAQIVADAMARLDCARGPWRPENLLLGPRVLPALRDLVGQLGARYAQCTLENFCFERTSMLKQQAALRQLFDFAENMPKWLKKGGGLVLTGKPGTGKDHLLAALLKIAVVRYGLTVAWFDGMRLYADARHAISEDKERELMTKLTKPLVLAISDPQPPKGDLTPWQTQLLRDAIDRRYRELKSTWLTTNLDTKEGAEGMFTAPLLDRIKENSLQVSCDWPSYRKAMG